MKRETKADKVELVETQNLYLSFKRLDNSGHYDGERKWRALHHALGMLGGNSDALKKIREAMGLP